MLPAAPNHLPRNRTEALRLARYLEAAGITYLDWLDSLMLAEGVSC